MYQLMNLRLTAILSAAALLMTGTPVPADFLPNNFWANATFEKGTNLVQPDGTPTGWNRDGSDPTICQVATNNYVSPGHALAVVDENASGYGEWFSDLVNLTGRANPGDAISVQWFEVFNITDGEMRVTVGFFDAANTFIAETHFVVTGPSSGWQGTVENSTFTKRTESLAVPGGAAKLRVSLVSGGSEATVGVMMVDDLSVAVPPQPRLLAGNLWPNASFENGDNLDSADGTPSGWNRGGNDVAICRVLTNNYVSAGHALAVVDSSLTGYGEWYSDLGLSGKANPGDTLNLQWFELYSITNGEMRVTVLFFNAQTNVVQENHFVVTGKSALWQGAIEGSGFTQRNQPLVVPPGATKMRVSLVSGGPATTKGVMLIDDLSVAPPPQPALLAGNFWPNPTFELGSNLNRSSGTPTNWLRAGSATNICQVTTNNYTSQSHALAVIDGTESGYGEWDSDLNLGTNAAPGDLLDFQWAELYSVTNGEMRVTVLFFDGTGAQLSAASFTATGQSGGWRSRIADSSFTLRKGQLLIPANASRLRLSLVSGGPETTTGVMVIDDLSAARHPVPPTVLAGNFFPNPTFEDGAQLDNPTLALPAGGWQRGGNDAAIDQVTTNNAVSPTHALALVDNSEANYGEWYLFYSLAGVVSDGDMLDVQWYQVYSVTNGNMRLSMAFVDSANDQLANQDFPTVDQSPGWTGTVAGSPFEKRNERLEVPAGAVNLRVNFASGGSASVTGLMAIDDLSVRLSRLSITGISRDATGVTITWASAPGKSYSIMFRDTLSPGTQWSSLVTGVAAADGMTTSWVDTANHSGSQGYYRVVQE